MDKCTPYYRQLLVATTSHLAGLSVGSLAAYPIVLLDQLPADTNVSMDVDSSWIASVQGIAGTLSIIITPLMQWKGRKVAFIGSTLTIIIGWALITIAKNATTIIIGELFQGFGNSSSVIVSLVTISEMIDPKSRSLAMLLFGAYQTIGAILVTIAGQFLHYKTVGMIMCVPNIISLVLSFMWPDSPSWLAYKGDFDRCEQTFTWLRGNSDDAKKELNQLIFAQKEIIKEKALKDKVKGKRNIVRKLFDRIVQRDFYLPILCMLLIMITFYGSGVMVLFLYGVQMVQKVTGITNSLIPIVLLDVTIGISSVLALILEKRCNNKHIFMFGGMASVIFLFLLCIVTYLDSAGILPTDSLLFLYCFLGFILSNASGLSSTVFIVSAELIPVKHRGLGGAIYLISMGLFHTLSIKTGLTLLHYLNFWGTLICFCAVATLGYVLIWKYIPETKNRTLQEIEDYFNNRGFKDDIKDDSTVNVPIFSCE